MLLVYLTVERIKLERSLRGIPLRIGVTGTRGKSSVTRLVAAALRDHGRNVLAKTTGARPALIFPDGAEREIPRAGPPSIREQIRLMNLASKWGADTLVSEFMSIGEECLATESRRIIRPGILALTNVRLDHLDEMGHHKEDIARTLSAAFSGGGKLFLPREEVYPVFEETAARLGIEIVPVEGPKKGEGDFTEGDPGVKMREEEAAGLLFPGEFEPNRRLALEILTSLGLSRDEALRGMSRARADFGSLRIWRVRLENPARHAYFVNAFAANDPESTSAVMEEIKTILPQDSRSLFGILCLREDRGDRTMQWIRAAEEGFFAGFEKVAVLGVPARAALIKLRRKHGSGSGRFFRPSDPSPEAVVTRLASVARRESVIIGLGNIVGEGERIVRYWERKGAPHAR